ncbi:MAG TPA: toll/interleukin-1 receptor domain-containing protein [Steroidobacteraceae bacterium]|nr:toll/interleukin-1 receptor domain-containing protein [Steroidobacteraceae bacterium]
MSTVFFSYSHADESYRDQLEIHLAMLKRQGVISVWHDRRLVAGDRLDSSIRTELDRADIILLLVSPDFLASEYCYGVEMTRALERQAQRSARVIPVILRPCEWHQAPFGGLLATPTDGKPVSKFSDPDDAFLQITKAIRVAAGPAAKVGNGPRPVAAATAAESSAGPRSSNLRVRKAFTERDRDRFLDDSFQFMARFFENSLSELGVRHPELETAFKRVDEIRFTAAVYRGGAAVARCKVQLGGHFGHEISFSYNDNLSDHSTNESLSVKEGEQALALRAMGMQSFGPSGATDQLSQEGAAEYYWELFMSRLQR